jgi:hypothetical protein
MAGLVKPIEAIPTQKSGTADWTTYYDTLVKAYGKNAAATIFAVTWRKYKGNGTDVVKIREHTKLPLDNESVMDSIRSAGAGAVGFFDGIPQFVKYGTMAVGGILILAIGGIVIRIITASAEDIGKVGGMAAKTYTGKP